ncbi:nuclear transport factor 2 family protein [Dactylosporangium sp. AC04546]|uniref:nuclear transport factor 2 family protein n=1 Tax=Dactylosporangium sp. AC04546 TaxID=2862460 RepID=UPI001EE115C4|nr:nuclear transport factor 2 family protein [Dactylosporangium sp. AC04546]WVK85556.1 nuclear transport factor 2 family protein [Dactylosporangium sp. AC04546]
MAERVLEQCRRFNDGVRTGEWEDYLAAFAESATLDIAGDPGGPYVGLDAIIAAYSADPPDDTITVQSVETSADVDVARFAWDRGGAGTLTVRWADGLIADFRVAFD